jgi:hexosaminidase
MKQFLLFLFCAILSFRSLPEVSMTNWVDNAAQTGPGSQTSAQTSPNTLTTLIPEPVSVEMMPGKFTLSAESMILVQPDTVEIALVGAYLAEKLRPATGYNLKVQSIEHAPTPSEGNIYLTTSDADASLGEEGYELTITASAVTLVANKPAGLFRGIQTIRQLLPPLVESATLQSGPWTLPAAVIRDFPRFAWRGAMLDVARHFFKVEEVKRFIDLLAYYKLNRFHIHLSDDQGWRLMINSWPNLATYGGTKAVGDDPGGYYTQQEYADIVTYAQSRYITVVPEIDMPGHTNAALASYPNLNCNDTAPDLYTGTSVGFSSLCVNKDITYTFITDVVRELAALTPGPYIHIGGDESAATDPDDYVKFVERVQGIVKAAGKQMVGWEEVSHTKLSPDSIVQHWRGDQVAQAVQHGTKVIMSPASKAYLDMKYSSSTELGLNWAGYVSVETAYNWDPAAQMSGVSDSDVLGIEAPLWTETIKTLADIEFMVFPRLPGYAEIGWSPVKDRSWSEYKGRLGAHGLRLTALGVNFYHDPAIPWQ